MGTIEDAFGDDAFDDPVETPKKQGTPPVVDHYAGVHVSAHKGDTGCLEAMKAAWSVIGEHCGTGAPLEIGPMTINVPAAIIYVANKEGSVAATRKAIADAGWCKETAERLYSSMSVFDHGSSSYLIGLANVEETIADAVINKFRPK